MKHDIIKYLRERWALQLQQEYDNICYRYGIKLKKPNLVVEDTPNSLGYWDKRRKLIVISESLIKKYSWEIVINVLKHEMAHQVVSEIFNHDEKHGDQFNRACQMLGLEKEFRGASIEMEKQFTHWKNKKTDSAEEALLTKIQKLLNLAQSSNEHEAALAMQKVQELYEKYNVKKIELGETSEHYSLIINFKKKKVPATHSIATFIVQNHFFVRIIFSSLYDALEDTTHKTIEIMGARQNVLMGEYVFHFLIERIEIIWLNYARQKKLAAKYKLSYQQGILEGFLKKLDESKKHRQVHAAHDNKKNEGLILLHDKKLEEYVQFKHPKLAKRGSSGGGVYSEHFNEGIEAGKLINLNKPIHSQNKHKGIKLLQ